MLALGEQHGAKIWGMLDDDELRQISVVMSTIGTIEAELVENLLLEFVSRMSASGAIMGNYDATERLLAAIPAAGAGRQHHGRNPRPRRPQHVGEALQRPGGDARQLSQERISADRRRGAVEDRPGARRARARHPARGAGARRGQPHAAHGGGAERSSGAGRADAAHRIHVQSVADAPPRRPRGDGGDLQQFRPPDRNPLHHRARRGQPRERRTHQDLDVHVRRSDQARHRLGADADAPRREGQARGRAQGRHRAGAPVLPVQHVDARRQDADGRHAGHGPGAAARGRRGAGAAWSISPRTSPPRARSSSPRAAAKKSWCIKP